MFYTYINIYYLIFFSNWVFSPNTVIMARLWPESNPRSIYLFICTSVTVESMQWVETCRCVPEDRNPLVYFHPPLLLSFERFTSLNPVSEHNHALLAPPLFFRNHFGRSSCDLHQNGREMWIGLSKEGKRKTKGEMKYDNWREPPRNDHNLHLGATYTGSVLEN